jgi:hypothetical protein
VGRGARNTRICLDDVTSVDEVIRELWHISYIDAANLYRRGICGMPGDIERIQFGIETRFCVFFFISTNKTELFCLALITVRE